MTLHSPDQKIQDSISIDAEMPEAEFKSHLPYAGLNYGSLTVQQEKFILLHVSGMSIAAAGRAAGYSTRRVAYETAKKPDVMKAIQYFREQMVEKVKFTAANAHHMYMESYSSAANSTEMRTTVDSLVKLHGLAVPDQQAQVNIQINGTKQLERMTDEDLLKLAGKDTQYLEPKSDSGDSED